MNSFAKVMEDLNIKGTLAQLDLHPELWNENPERRTGPHASMQDIWLRYRAKDELLTAESYREPHFPVWYPAWRTLDKMHGLVYGISGIMAAVHLGGVLITKIPPGGKILPHNDLGSWHAEYHNCKVYVPLQSDDGCWNECEGERVHMEPGEAWVFDNLKEHSVENNSERDRITLIVCMRVEP